MEHLKLATTSIDSLYMHKSTHQIDVTLKEKFIITSYNIYQPLRPVSHYFYHKNKNKNATTNIIPTSINPINPHTISTSKCRTILEEGNWKNKGGLTYKVCSFERKEIEFEMKILN